MNPSLLRFVFWALITLASAAPFAVAQQGDRGGEVQTPRVPAEMIPPAPALTPEEALKSFKIQDGFKIEIAASEPLIETPVALQFDPQGRMWVLEMRGFMPNEKGEGETEAVGRISVLEDSNNDGRMDRSTVFLEHLVMPRAIMLIRGGLLVAEPPLLWFYRDSNGDGVADQKSLVADNYATEANPLLGNRANQEHSANSLVWSLDNWIYSANYGTRFRNVAGYWERGATTSRGQWGLTQDNFGRLFHNSNSDQLRGDLVPVEYLSRNPNFTGAQGSNFRVAANQEVWPARVNPSVNRGYQVGQLRPDGTLATFTAAAAPVIYRGDNFPAEFQGNAFLCEPAGNLVRRNVLTESEGVITANNPYKESEFLTSTDERFRPVNLFNGPDGALYVVDIYRGLIQHRVYVTTYLLNQTLDRHLQAPINLGRIYRVVHPSRPLDPKPNLEQASSAELANALTSPNGWTRDTAQRLLVERADLSAVPALQKLAVSTASPLGQIHALWTLDGMGHPNREAILAALGSPDPKVRSAAIRVSESLLSTDAGKDILARLASLAADLDPTVCRQLAFSLGEVRDGSGDGILAAILLKNGANSWIREAVFTSLANRELEFAERLAAQNDWSTQSPISEQVFSTLARDIFTEGKSERLARMLDLISKQNGPTAWRQLTMLDGILGNNTAAAARGGRAGAGGAGAAGGRGGATGGRRGGAGGAKKLSAEPAAFAMLRAQGSDEINSRLDRLDAVLTWPGKPGAVAEEPVVPLTAEQEARFRAGKQIYSTTCGACHQPDGNGREGLAPPLLDSEWVLGSEARTIRIALQGVRGPINVKGKNYQLEMPPLAILSDEQIASVITYVRREWGHTASPVDPAEVTAIRTATSDRAAAWTEAELLRVQ